MDEFKVIQIEEASTKVESEVKRIPLTDWLSEGKRLFGDDPKLWRYVCSNCGHIQTIEDFLELKRLGLFQGDAQVAYFSCIGRFDLRTPDEEVGTIWDQRRPCNYTLGGLFCLAKTMVVDEDGKEHPVFEFDRTEGASADDNRKSLVNAQQEYIQDQANTGTAKG